MKKTKSQYELEANSFRENFATLRDKRLAIYGIGRRTLSLLPYIKDFKVVGLLDRDAANVGKVIGDVPVISLADAEAATDVIIINSDPTNFQVIYRRIASTNLPVYYANGELASLPSDAYAEFWYWTQTEQRLWKAIEEHDIISFDFFDTLAMRRCLDPTDVFRLLGRDLRKHGWQGKDFTVLRQQAVGQSGREEPTLNEIYESLAGLADISTIEADRIKEQEIKLEEHLLLPRRIIVDVFQKARACDKKVYIVSDTYFQMPEFLRLMAAIGIHDFPAEHILLSSEYRKSKRSGALWQILSRRLEQKRALHIGDSRKEDVDEPRNLGLDVFQILSAKEMLAHSSLGQLLPHAVNLTDSLHLGLLAAELFNNPFELAESRGHISLTRPEQFGYVVLGSSILRFLSWLRNEARRNDYRKLAFFARDGYFLKQDFDFLCNSFPAEGSKPETLYVPASRRLFYMASMQTDEDYRQAVTFPYLGSFTAYLHSRFNLEATDISAAYNDKQVNAAEDGEQLLEWLQPYKSEIWQEAGAEHENYLQVLSAMSNSWDHTGTVDLGYYGTNQRYFQKITGQRFDGYYFYACYLSDNEYLNECRMHCCFNDESDPVPEHNPIKRKSAFMESFLTAPYGMIRYVDENGGLICETGKSNQRYFTIKEEANEGVKRYICDYISLYGSLHGDGIDRIEARIYEECLNDGCTLGKEILQGFYFDNDMVGSKEMPLGI